MSRISSSIFIRKAANSLSRVGQGRNQRKSETYMQVQERKLKYESKSCNANMGENKTKKQGTDAGTKAYSEPAMKKGKTPT